MRAFSLSATTEIRWGVPLTTPLRRPPGRYDEPRRLSRGAVAVVAAVFGAVLLLGLYQAYDRFGSPDVRWQVRGYEVVSDAVVRVELEVVADGPAACRLAARAEDGREVGTAVVEVPAPPAGRRSTVVTGEVSTSARATTGVVRRCDPAP